MKSVFRLTRRAFIIASMALWLMLVLVWADNAPTARSYTLAAVSNVRRFASDVKTALCPTDPNIAALADLNERLGYSCRASADKDAVIVGQREQLTTAIAEGQKAEFSATDLQSRLDYSVRASTDKDQTICDLQGRLTAARDAEADKNRQLIDARSSASAATAVANAARQQLNVIAADRDRAVAAATKVPAMTQSTLEISDLCARLAYSGQVSAKLDRDLALRTGQLNDAKSDIARLQQCVAERAVVRVSPPSQNRAYGNVVDLNDQSDTEQETSFGSTMPKGYAMTSQPQIQTRTWPAGRSSIPTNRNGYSYDYRSGTITYTNGRMVFIQSLRH